MTLCEALLRTTTQPVRRTPAHLRVGTSRSLHRPLRYGRRRASDSVQAQSDPKKMILNKTFLSSTRPLPRMPSAMAPFSASEVCGVFRGRYRDGNTPGSFRGIFSIQHSFGARTMHAMQRAAETPERLRCPRKTFLGLGLAGVNDLEGVFESMRAQLEVLQRLMAGDSD